jgi:competence ComEA-like helix-hairpin-helix protein
MFRRPPILSAALAFVACAAFVAPALANKKPPPEPINLNTATSEELQQVPGIGPSTADKILQFRKSYGAFKSVDDQRAIRGIGPKRLEKMRKYLVAGKTPSKATTGPAKNASASAKKPPPTSSAAAAKKPAPPATKPAPDADESEEP